MLSLNETNGAASPRSRTTRGVRAALSAATIIATMTVAACGSSGSAGTAAYSPPPAPAGPVTTIVGLSTITNLASMVAANKDGNPYGLAIVPASFNGLDASGAKSVLQPGDLVISDFSNSTGANTGTSILLYRPSTGAVMPFYSEHIGAGPVALAVSSKGTTWIANYLPGYMNSLDGDSTGDGNVVVITPDGTDFPNNEGIIDNASGATFSPAADTFAGPWGQAFGVKSGTTTPYFFVTEVDNGTGWVQREAFTPPNFDHETVTTIGYVPVNYNAFDPTGPQGMVYDPATDILYVASTATNSIVAFPNATTSPASMTTGVTVYQGSPLNAPVGLTMNPINGDLISGNQLDNNLVEIAPNPYAQGSGYAFSAKLVGTKLVDTTAVNATAGTGSALFGLAASKDSSGNLMVYFVDDNTNSLDVLKQ